MLFAKLGLTTSAASCSVPGVQTRTLGATWNTLRASRTISRHPFSRRCRRIEPGRSGARLHNVGILLR
jgi:hypothetical protein